MAVLALIIALGLSGCGGGDGDEVTETDDANASSDEGVEEDADDAEDGEADGADAGSGDSDDGDFPIPIADGVLLDVLADAGIESDGQRQLYYADEDFDRVVAFYEDYTTSGGEWSSFESDGAVGFQRIDGEITEMITIAPNEDPGALADGPVTVVLLIAG